MIQQTLPQEVVQDLSTIRDFIRWGVTQFNQAQLAYGHGTDNAWDESVFLVLASLHLPPDMDLQVLDAKLITSEKVMLVERIQQRVTKRIPVPYLIKEAWFAGLNFYVDERVIIPRSPIAELIGEEFRPWVSPNDVKNILDMGTGSGCIAISAALAFPEAKVDAVDISESALDVAEINLNRFKIDNVTLIQSNLFENVPKKKYDIIVSNPPYVSAQELATLSEEYHHEPLLALSPGADPLTLVRQILQKAINFLTPKGILVVEVGFSQSLLEKEFPGVPFTWLQFASGGEGVFLLTHDELQEYTQSS